MPTKDVEPDVFQMMLRYVYDMEIIFPWEWKEHSKEILQAAGKYGFSALKSEAEAWHLKNLELMVENVIDELLYSDGTHCLDLKNANIMFIVENGQRVLASSLMQSFTNLRSC